MVGFKYYFNIDDIIGIFMNLIEIYWYWLESEKNSFKSVEFYY